MRLTPIGAVFLYVCAIESAHADGLDPVGRKTDWRNEQIDDVVAFPKFGSKSTIDGKECVTGGYLNFKVNDEVGYDIDEPVDVDVEFEMQPKGARLALIHDGNGLFPSSQPPIFIDVPSSLEAKGKFYRKTIKLDRARFANTGFQGADIAIFSADPLTQFTLCDMHIKRSYTTPVNAIFGHVALEVTDNKGLPTPVRVGLYDSTGRMPLPSDEAIPLRNGAQGITRITEVGGYSKDVPVWPGTDRSIFYIDGRYQARLAPGTYQLVVAKGPEYRIVKQSITITPNVTSNVKIAIERWIDMPTSGWYSGDSHFHYSRDSAYDDKNLQIFLQAEDVRVGNNFQMGNMSRAYLPQYSWEPILYGAEKDYALVIGQEDPRTSLLGHVAEMNIRKPFRDKPNYLLYDAGMRRARSAGGLVGYAHAVDPARDCPADITHSDVGRGMAIDVPAGLVDYMEIMSVNCMGDSLWFDFLNLGFHLAPAAGTDYPVGPVLGGMRSYVKLDGPFIPQRWYNGLKAGHTFVTTGPMLQFKANGQEMGSELKLRPGQQIQIHAEASLSPDFGSIAALELVEQGVVVKSVSPISMNAIVFLDYSTPARQGTWFVIRVRGEKPGVMAWSSPIYVPVSGQRTWKKEAVPSLVAAFKSKMQGAIQSSPPLGDAVEPFDTMVDMNRYWSAQQPLLQKRIADANAQYDMLVKLSKIK